MTLRKQTIVWMTVLFLSSGVLTLQAQPVQKGVSQLPKALGKNAAAEVPAVSAWKNFQGVIPAAAAESVAKSTAKSSLKSRIAQKYPGAVVAYEQRVNKLSLQQALRRAVELRGPTPAKGWVKTTPESITVPNLRGLTLDNYPGDVPDLPVPTNKIYLYRGMGLDENALRNVLTNGLRPQDVGSQANALNTQMRLVGMGTMPVTQDMMKDMDVKQTYLTPKASETMHYAYMHSFAEGRIPVVVTVRGWRENDSHHVVSEIIPASDFVEVSAMVKGPQGTPIWCRVKLAEDGKSFVFAPYVK